ncbi:DUF2514 family protein [Raoultella planticola]|uniref:DUF2514 family protein n=1 Tax=Raoultella planticola TaxID=575 RepID=UPI0015DDFDD9|nr:DUF2514 family protein [Raoultella planticola]DAM72910.1 MAG TPA: Protein of unknown function (DUF2514) [Caudoviricetes sp.]
MKTKYAVLIGLIVASSLGGVGYVIHESAFEAGKKDNDKEWKLKWSERDKADKEAQLTQEQAQREEELRRKKKTEEIVNDAEREKQKALADAADADNAADQLRGQLAKIRRELATSETGRISADAARRQTAAETASLLADLYEESDRRAGEIAKYADAAASAGSVCERTYDAVTRSVE